MIEVKGISKSYGLNVAVRDISFSAKKGEIIGLIGRNGAGKSTTMNIIAGYISSDEGNVSINGHDILKEPVEAKRHLGYMPEFPPLYTEMTVYKYLEFVCKLMNVAKNEISSHLKDIFEEVGLNEVRDRLISNLSKGYKQRVGIAKALCGNPENVVLDEPTSGLDPKQIVEIRQVIRSLGKDHTVIISSHILKELADICTRLVIIDRGVIVADDTLDNLLTGAGNGRTIRLSLKNGSGLLDKLKDIEGVAGAELVGEANGVADYDINEKTGADLSEAISKAATDSGATIIVLKHLEYSLEDVFLKLTEGSAEEGAEK
jgi:ABC-2 type transport system ATP-binding protein